MDLLGIKDIDEIKESHRKWIEDALKRQCNVRESRWTESVAVGGKSFVEGTKEKLGIKVKGRKVVEREEAYELREPQGSYGS